VRDPAEPLTLQRPSVESHATQMLRPLFAIYVSRALALAPARPRHYQRNRISEP